jgi:catechol 2,3-dioxygenase-like lactoylglutathione lyase family enzyme
VILNLVELGAADPATRVGRMRRFVKEDHGYTSQGLTPVVTTQHSVRDVASATRFYEVACGMSVYFDAVLEAPAQNAFHRFETDTRSDVRFMVGNHLFGKVALIQPRNHAFAELAARAAPPAIGYLAQAFLVPDARHAAAAALGCGAEALSPVVAIDVPGIGPSQACLVRSPGSGALVQLIEPVTG